MYLILSSNSFIYSSPPLFPTHLQLDMASITLQEMKLKSKQKQVLVLITNI